MTLEITQYDDSEGVHGVLKRKGETVNLTDAHVTFHMDQGRIEGTAQVLDAENGEVYFPLQGETTAKLGLFMAEFKVKKNGVTRTYPNGEKIRIHIKKGES